MGTMDLYKTIVIFATTRALKGWRGSIGMKSVLARHKATSSWLSPHVDEGLLRVGMFYAKKLRCSHDQLWGNSARRAVAKGAARP